MKPGTRPPRTFATGTATRLLRLLAWCACVPVTAVAVIATVRADGQVPVHFDAAGDADRYGSPVEGLVAALVLVGVVALCLGLSYAPQVYNYPAAVTPENAQAVYREGERLMVWTAAACLVLGAGVTASIFAAGSGLGALTWVGLGLMLVALVAGLVRTVRAARTVPVPA